MKNNYLKNKFLLSLSIAATLLSFSAISALAQNQDPSAAVIEQARRKLKARLRSLQNGNMAHYLSQHFQVKN